MRTFVRIMAAAALLALLPGLAAAQGGSTISGVVKDASGAVLPGVTVEAASPALIEKTRTVITDSAGQYAIVQLRPGIYTVTFTLPGFSVVKRENVELTTDFTSTINAEMKVGALEETITVSAESPIVDVQSITARTVMTREVLDAIPTGRNIQAVGIMIPGTTIAVGGGNALSRDVGGSGGTQQSPLQYRGSTDTVQTIEGLRLNNLCAQGAYSGVYWNDGSFQEISYVTGADSAEMGQGGIRVNMVPKDGGNTFHGSMMANYAGNSWAADNLRSNLSGDITYNPNNRLTNVGTIQKVWDFNPSIGGPIKKDKIWFNFTFRHWGVNKSVADSYFDADPSPFKYAADLSRPGVDDGHIVSRAVRLSWQISQKDKFSVYHDDQSKYRDHWGISANVPPETSAIQVTPTSLVSVWKWTRTQSNRLLFDAGVGIYDQEYTELYPESVTGLSDKVFDLAAIRNSRVYTICDNSTGVCAAATGKVAGAWPNPADHFSKLITYSGSASYVTGSHAFRFGGAVTQGDWRLVRQWTGDVQPIEYLNGAPAAVTLRLPSDRRNGIKADTGLFAQDRWTINRLTVNAGLRYDWFIGESQESDVLPSQYNAGQHYGKCADGKNDPKAGCVGTVQDWKDLSPRIGVSLDLFGDGRTALKGSIARYVNGQQIAIADDINPVSALSITDRRPWTTDLDGNGSPIGANGAIQFNELGTSTATPTFGRNVSTTSYDPSVLNGWFKRGYNLEYTVAAQHQLGPRTSINGGWFRRSFGNQIFTDDLRFDRSSYDGPFCANAPADSRLPGGGGFPVCNLYDLKPSVFALGLPANSLVRFSDDVGGETNIYKGLDINLESRFSNGAFIRGGITAGTRTFDNCNLLNAGFDASSGGVVVQPEQYTDGTSYCHRYYPYRPDVKILGSYTLPLDILISGTYQFSRGVQAGGAGGSSILASWSVASAQFGPTGTVGSTLGRALNAGSSTKTIALIRDGLEYGDENLNQLDLRASKRFRFNQYRMRIDFDLYNVFNSNWPYSVNNTFSNAATSAWLRPTNVLQSRFFKIGGQFDF